MFYLLSKASTGKSLQAPNSNFTVWHCVCGLKDNNRLCLSRRDWCHGIRTSSKGYLHYFITTANFFSTPLFICSVYLTILIWQCLSFQKCDYERVENDNNDLKRSHPLAEYDDSSFSRLMSGSYCDMLLESTQLARSLINVTISI